MAVDATLAGAAPAEPSRKRRTAPGMAGSLVAFALLSLHTSGVRADPQPPPAQSGSEVPEAAPSKDASVAPSRDASAASQVTIEGQQANIEQRVEAFVTQITAGSPSDALELWRQPICPLVAGLSREQGEFVLARLSQVATAAGAPLAPQQCRPNFFVTMTPNPERLLQEWRSRDHHLFGRAGATAIKRFIETPRPVRVWHNTQREDANGVVLRGDDLDVGGAPGGAAVAINGRAADSRLERAAVTDLASVIMVVDTNRLQGLKVGQVADYVAMAGLAKLDLDADVTSAPTILRLFAATPAAAAPEALTPWDEAFLKALYHTRQHSPAQRSMITRTMVRDLPR
jgi:hypothetical protein